MQWEDLDINVAVPHFSKLNDTGIPLRLIESFLDDALVNLIVNVLTKTRKSQNHPKF